MRSKYMTVLSNEGNDQLRQEYVNCVVSDPKYSGVAPLQVGSPFIQPFYPYNPSYEIITTTGSLVAGDQFNIQKAENGYILVHNGKSYIYANKEELSKKIAELIS